MKKAILFSMMVTGVTMGAAHAADGFTTVAPTAAVPMTSAQMAGVEAKAHIGKLVAHQGVELPDGGATATAAAAPTPMGGDFVRSPSREATAFDFLN